MTIHIGGYHRLGGVPPNAVSHIHLSQTFSKNQFDRSLHPSPISTISPPSASIYITSIQGNIYHIHIQAHIQWMENTACIFTYILNPRKTQPPMFFPPPPGHDLRFLTNLDLSWYTAWHSLVQACNRKKLQTSNKSAIRSDLGKFLETQPAFPSPPPCQNQKKCVFWGQAVLERAILTRQMFSSMRLLHNGGRLTSLGGSFLHSDTVITAGPLRSSTNELELFRTHRQHRRGHEFQLSQRLLLILQHRLRVGSCKHEFPWRHQSAHQGTTTNPCARLVSDDKLWWLFMTWYHQKWIVLLVHVVLANHNT